MQERAINSDFVAGRCSFVDDKLRHNAKYEEVNRELLSCNRKLKASFWLDEQHELLGEISERRIDISVMTEEACYLQGFRDMVRLMAGMPLEN